MATRSIAVTGGVASGKSEATRAFEALGVAVVDADVAARAVVEPGTPALAALARRFGDGILAADGRLDRAAMRERIFNDPAAKADLEALLHPPIRRWLEAASQAATGDYVVVAIPLLAEGGGRAAYPWLDRILVIDVPVALQLQRLQSRDGIPEALATRMIEAQASRGQRLAIADDIIVNDGSREALRGCVARLHAYYLSMNDAPGTGGRPTRG
jgi:dephospho-CoA kinase